MSMLHGEGKPEAPQQESGDVLGVSVSDTREAVSIEGTYPVSGVTSDIAHQVLGFW